MKTNELILRCYSEQEQGSWVAVCVDLNLAAQAESQALAKHKLESMIQSYVTEALTTDLEYAEQLLTRKAPWPMWIRYYTIKLLSAIHANHSLAFNEIMPMRPA